MKYTHIVKYNGVYYAAGQEVPEVLKAPESPKEPKETPAKASKPKAKGK